VYNPAWLKSAWVNSRKL